MTATIDVDQTTLSEILLQIKSGDTIILTQGEEKLPVARIEAVPPTVKNPKRLGALEHLHLHIPDSFFSDPLAEEELRAWEGGID